MRNSAPAGRHTYPALRCALPVIAGILLERALAVSASVLLAFIGLSCISVCAGLRIRKPTFLPPLFSTIAPTLLLTALGMLAMSGSSSRATAEVDSLTVRPVTLIGTVIDLPVARDRRIRFPLRCEGCVNAGGSTPVHCTLAVTIVADPADTGRMVITYGMLLALHGDLSVSGPERNPGEFNPRQYDRANGIAGHFVVRGAAHVRILEHRGGSWPMRTIIAPLRAAILRQIDMTVGGEEGEFLKGLLLGDRSGISSATNRAFIDAGVAHVLAVSGSNVAVVALILIFLYDLVRLPRGARPLMVAAGLVTYMILTGSQTPVVRATVMALVFLLAGVTERPSNAYNSLGLSALIILLYDAQQLFDVGFQLSFGAVFSIIHLYPRVNRWISRLPSGAWWQRSTLGILRVCAVSLVATLGTLPMTAVYFGRVSLIGILANILVVPATGLSVVLGACGLVLGLVSSWAGSIEGAANAFVLHWTIAFTRVCASAPFATVDAFRFSAFHALPFYSALCLVFHLRDNGVVRVSLITLLASLNVACFMVGDDVFDRPDGVLRVTFIDVGQGDAMLVECPGHSIILIDGGPWSPGIDAGEKTVTPFLKRRGITRADLLIVSHPDADHLGGVASVIRHFDIGRVIDNGQAAGSTLYSSYLSALTRRGRARIPAREGALIPVDTSLRLYVLAPAPQFVGPDSSGGHNDLNNASVVLKLVYGDVSFLFTGDAGEKAEQVMVKRFGKFLRSTVLKVGHHGSTTSSSPDFLKAVRPSFAALSVGLHNKFHHPSPVVIRRLESLGTTVMRTDRDGAVMMETDEERSAGSSGGRRGSIALILAPGVFIIKRESPRTPVCDLDADSHDTTIG